MGLVEQDRAREHSADPRLADNERLIAETRAERVRHASQVRLAERKIRSGLAAVRRATLRVVSS